MKFVSSHLTDNALAYFVLVDKLLEAASDEEEDKVTLSKLSIIWEIMDEKDRESLEFLQNIMH